MNSNILYMESTESNRICHSTYLSPGSTSRRPMYAMFFADKLKIIEKNIFVIKLPTRIPLERCFTHYGNVSWEITMV